MGWPTADDVKRRIGITRTDADVDADVASALAAAVETVSEDCETWLEDHEAEPDERLRQAALLLAVSTYKAPDAPHGVAGVFDVSAIRVAREHPQYESLIRGHRSNFGIA